MRLAWFLAGKYKVDFCLFGLSNDPAEPNEVRYLDCSIISLLKQWYVWREPQAGPQTQSFGKAAEATQICFSGSLTTHVFILTYASLFYMDFYNSSALNNHQVFYHCFSLPSYEKKAKAKEENYHQIYFNANKSQYCYQRWVSF